MRGGERNSPDMGREQIARRALIPPSLGSYRPHAPQMIPRIVPTTVPGMACRRTLLIPSMSMSWTMGRMVCHCTLRSASKKGFRDVSTRPPGAPSTMALVMIPKQAPSIAPVIMPRKRPDMPEIVGSRHAPHMVPHTAPHTAPPPTRHTAPRSMRGIGSCAMRGSRATWTSAPRRAPQTAPQRVPVRADDRRDGRLDEGDAAAGMGRGGGGVVVGCPAMGVSRGGEGGAVGAPGDDRGVCGGVVGCRCCRRCTASREGNGSRPLSCSVRAHHGQERRWWL